jgi:hypothetical protein
MRRSSLSPALTLRRELLVVKIQFNLRKRGLVFVADRIV